MLSKLFRFLIKLVFVASAAVMALGLLAVALVVLVFSLMKALITGKRPAAAVMFRRFQNPQNFPTNGPWPAASPRSNATATSPSTGEVVDVEAREVRDDKRLP